jgi:hypothetical protein
MPTTFRRHFLLACAWLAACGSQPSAPPARVATFARTPILVAYYKSAHRAEIMRALVAERDAAKARGDAAAAEACERRGAESQEHAHRQLAGDAPLDNVLALLQPHLHEVAAAVGATTVVEAGQEPRGSNAVDVTDRLVALMPPAHRDR